MTDLMAFQFDNQPIRVHIDAAGDPWWIARDVCEVLGLPNYRKAMSRVELQEKGVTKVHTLGGPQDVTTVNEAGLYRLIFRSNKPDTKRFQTWVFHEVLPTIRKTGSYRAPASPPEPSVETPLLTEHATSAQKLRAAQEIEGELALCRAFQLPQHIAAARAGEMAQRATGLDLSYYIKHSPLMLHVAPDDEFHTITEYSKEFDLKPGVLNNYLFHLNYQTRRHGTDAWEATTQALELGVCRPRSEPMHGGKKIVYYIEWRRSFIVSRIIPWLTAQPKVVKGEPN